MQLGCKRVAGCTENMFHSLGASLGYDTDDNVVDEYHVFKVL
jgi:hypothetical protein